ncbi:MAG: thioredoxin family protein [Saprospiraceae bacterium]|nr:thioredoxin family protein [Saprospiraceae bacterium]
MNFKQISTLATLVLFGALTLVAQNEAKPALESGIDFFHGTYDEALAKAKAENKIVFMDAFTEWCGPCKRMAATTFKEAKVGKFFNENFVNVKMDMEKGEGVTLSRKFDVTAYPTLLFLNEKGEQVHKSIGALQAEQLIGAGRLALGKIDKTKDFEKDYQAGKREPELVLNYVRALNRAGKSSLKVVNEYLLKADMANPATLKIIFEGTTQADSKVFDLLVKNKAQIVPLYSEAQFNSKVEDAIQKTLENAVEFKSLELHKEAKDKMKTHLPDKAQAFALEADMKYYKATSDVKNYCKACESFVKKEGKTNANVLYSTAKQMIDAFPTDKDILSNATKYLKTAAENGGLCEYYFLYAKTLNLSGKKSDALTNAEKALKLAKDNAIQMVPVVQNLIDQIKG